MTVKYTLMSANKPMYVIFLTCMCGFTTFYIYYQLCKTLCYLLLKSSNISMTFLQNILCIQLLSCEDLLFFFFLCDSKLNIYRFSSVQTKPAVVTSGFRKMVTDNHVSYFQGITDRLINKNSRYLQPHYCVVFSTLKVTMAFVMQQQEKLTFLLIINSHHLWSHLSCGLAGGQLDWRRRCGLLHCEDLLAKCYIDR